MIRAGHPWVFRESLLRPLTDLAAGHLVALADEDGYPLASGLFEPDGAIALRIVGPPDVTWDRATLEQRIRLAQRLRDSHVDSATSRAYRVVHGEGDGIPGVAVDRLGDFLLIYRYSRAAEAFTDDLVAALETVHQPAGIYLQDRVRPVTPDERRGGALHVAGKTAPTEFEVEEDGLRYWVDVTAPVSPGLFLDLRLGRRLCESLARDRRVLNLFSYTGSLALRAVRGGAREVTNVDSSARAHARCRQNLEASGLDVEACEAVSGDVFKHLERWRQRRRTFDLVVVDPPPFSKVGAKVFSALRDWKELMRGIAPVVAPDGLVLAVSNASGLSEQEFLTALGEGARAAEREVRLIGEVGLPPDFPVPPAFAEGRYLRIKLLHLP